MSRRYFRQITASVLRWYVELEDGVIPGAAFDTSVLDYRIDVERALASLGERSKAIILSVHRDGMTHAQALVASGVTADRPDSYVALLEAKAGERLERRGLADITTYLNPFVRRP